MLVFISALGPLPDISKSFLSETHLWKKFYINMPFGFYFHNMFILLEPLRIHMSTEQ